MLDLYGPFILTNGKGGARELGVYFSTIMFLPSSGEGGGSGSNTNMSHLLKHLGYNMILIINMSPDVQYKLFWQTLV